MLERGIDVVHLTILRLTHQYSQINRGKNECMEEL